MIDFPEILATHAKFRQKRPPPINPGGGAGPAKAAGKRQPTPIEMKKYLKYHSKHDPDSRKSIDIYVRKIQSLEGARYLVFGNRRLTGKPAINANGELDGQNYVMLGRKTGPVPTPDYNNDPGNFFIHPWVPQMFKAELNADTSPITLNGVKFSGDQMSPSTLTPEELRKLELI